MYDYPTDPSTGPYVVDNPPPRPSQHPQPSDYQPYQPVAQQPRRRRHWMWIVPLVIVLVAAAAVGGFVYGHDKGRTDGRRGLVTNYLSHGAVENYIAVQFQAGTVRCNGGNDVPLQQDGTFTCSSSTGAHFDGTIQDAATGRYLVRPVH
jgi:hypothetical protein